MNEFRQTPGDEEEELDPELDPNGEKLLSAISILSNEDSDHLLHEVESRQTQLKGVSYVTTEREHPTEREYPVELRKEDNKVRIASILADIDFSGHHDVVVEILGHFGITQN